MLNKEIPFLRIGLPVCIGIIAGRYLNTGILFLTASFFVIIAGFVTSLLYNKGLVNQFFGLPMTYGLFICGMVLYENEKKQISVLEPTRAEYICSVSEYPDEKGNSFRTILKLYAVINGNEPAPVKGSMMIYFRKDPLIATLLPGDFLRISCKPMLIKNRGNPYEFDYSFYMENHGIKYYSIAGEEDVSFHFPPAHRKLKHRALIVRERILEMYRERGITDDRIGLVAAITLGQKNMLDPEQKQVFIKAGIMHIMAVSGLHAVILSIFIFSMLFFMKGKLNIFRILITVLLLWCFAFVTGLTPSVLRATIMFTFLQAGKLMKRNVNSINSVLASAVVLIIIRPSVIFDAGFLLSYSAVIFIICFYRELYLKVNLRTWAGDKIWQSAAVTILAQAGTLPLTISLFNRFPVWFMLTNIIIVPLSSLLIIVGCLVPLTYPLKFVSHPLALLMNHLTSLTEWLTEKAASLPISTIDNIGMTSIETGLLFSFIFIFTLSVMNRKLFPLRYPLFILMLFMAAGTIRSISDRTSGELIVYNGIGASTVGIRTGRVLNLYSDADTIQPDVVKHCVTRGLKINLIASESQIQHLEICGRNIIICNRLTDKVLQIAKPDLVILKGKYPSIQNEPGFDGHVEAVIIGSDAVINERPNLELNRVKPDTVHFVRSDGAFRRRL